MKRLLVLLTSAMPQRFETWIQRLRDAGMEVREALPSWGDLARTVQVDAPDVVLVDTETAPHPAEPVQVVRHILDRLHFGASPAYIAITGGTPPEPPLHAAIDDMLDAAAAPEESLRRVEWAAEHRPPSAVHLGELRISLTEASVTIEDRVVRLNRREFELLWFLVRHSNRLFSREELLQNVWAARGEVRRPPSIRAVDGSVRRLRRQLGRYGANICTVPGRGYYLAGPGCAEPRVG